MMRENDKEAKSIIANTTNKMFMRMEELEATAKLAIDSGGQGFKAQMQGWSGKAGDSTPRSIWAQGLSVRLQAEIPRDVCYWRTFRKFICHRKHCSQSPARRDTRFPAWRDQQCRGYLHRGRSSNRARP